MCRALSTNAAPFALIPSRTPARTLPEVGLSALGEPNVGAGLARVNAVGERFHQTS
jgi:hypothetical protein